MKASPNHNAAVTFEAAALAQPDKVALHFFETGRPRQLSYGQLLSLSSHFARSVYARGGRPGDRAVLLAKPGPSFFALTLGLLRAGLVPVFVDTGGGLAHLKACIRAARPRLFIASWPLQLARRVLGWTAGVCSSLGTHPRFWRLDAAGSSDAADTFATAAVLPKDLALIAFTSGSTGPAKGVLHSHANLRAQVSLLQQLYPVSPATVDMPTLPVFTLFDLALGLSSVLADTNTLSPAKADPAKLTAAMETFGVKQLFGSPVLIDTLSRYAVTRGLTFSNLERVVSAGAPAEAEALRRMQMVSPKAEVVTPYGATECLPISSVAADTVVRAAPRTAQGAGICVGRPAPETRAELIRITDAALPLWQADFRVPPGEVGEVTVAGPQVSERYLDNPEADRAHKIRDGELTLHRTGDLGYLDADGQLWLVGRKNQRVITAAETLFTLPCERVVTAHPAVARAALVGVPAKFDQTHYQKAVICAELYEPNGAQDELREELLELLASSPVTRTISTILFHPKLPTDARHNSKLRREVIAVWAAELLNRQR